jgi:hypothetical protein
VELSPLATVGWSAAAVVVACWLTVSFSGPGLRRLRAGWLGAVAMYVAFVCLFLSLFLRARAGDNTAATIGFGFLLALFSAGFVLASYRFMRALAGKSGDKVESATH